VALVFGGIIDGEEDGHTNERGLDRAITYLANHC
jgi:hypothetical protein